MELRQPARATPSCRRPVPATISARSSSPNRHIVYMHDTLPVRKKYFETTSRLVGHVRVRMEKPQSFAEVLLAEDKGWSAAQAKELWDKGNNSAVTSSGRSGCTRSTSRRSPTTRHAPDVRRGRWSRPQACRGAVRQCQRLSAASARYEQAAAERDRRNAVDEQQRQPDRIRQRYRELDRRLLRGLRRAVDIIQQRFSRYDIIALGSTMEIPHAHPISFAFRCLQCPVAVVTASSAQANCRENFGCTDSEYFAAYHERELPGPLGSAEHRS